MAVDFKDYYRILGVDRKADDKTIKSAYRRLARKHHPDVAKGKDSADRFKEINEAYEVLSDPEKRRRYDSLGPDWQRYTQAPPGGGPGGGFRVEYGGDIGDAGDFSDFFRTIFGDMGGRGRGARGEGIRLEDLFQRGQSARGGDVQAGIEISLDEAFHGARKTFAMDIEEPCATCHGSGHVKRQPCTACGGGGWQQVRCQVDVKIPAGVKGDDIHLTLPVTAPEAALGTSIEVPTLRGKVSMKIPPATSSGRTFRLPGYGMPRIRGGGAGDQLVTARIMMPAELTAAEKELYERLQALRTDSPRGYAQG